MARIPLTIDPNYCREWRFEQGVRELVQNAKDAEEFAGFPMEIEHLPRTNKLVISNRGAVVDRSALLLLGKTSKDDGRQRGQFGEGFVLGVLALVRDGHPVTIYNGDEVWRPAIEAPDEGHPFEGQKLLVFNTRKLQAPRDVFTVEVENVPREVWAETKMRFLFLTPPAPAEITKVHGGAVLHGAVYAGKIFARGIYVNQVEDLECGYDLEELQLDRDRRFIDEYNLRWKLAQLWNEAYKAHPEASLPRLYRMAKSERWEVKNLSYTADTRLLEALRAEFEREHGWGTIAVESAAEVSELEQLGAKATVVNRTVRELLDKTGPRLSEIRERLKGAVGHSHGWDSLAEAEREACRTWVERVTQRYAIVTFKDPTVTSRLIDGGHVGLSRSLLAGSPRDLLRAIVPLEATRTHRVAEEVWLDALGVPAHEPTRAGDGAVPPQATAA